MCMWQIKCDMCSHSLSPLAVCVSDEKTLYLTPEQEKDKSHFTDKEVKPCSLSLGVIHTVAHSGGSICCLLVNVSLRSVSIWCVRMFTDWAGPRADWKHASAGVVCQQLQEVWSHAGDCHRQESGRVSVCQGLRWHRGWVHTNQLLFYTIITWCPFVTVMLWR